MLNSAFVDKSTGEQVRIIQEDVNFYVLDNSVRIKKDVFTKKYEAKQEIDPNSFFQTQSSSDPLLNLAQQLRNMDTSKIPDDGTGMGTRVKFIESPVTISDNSLPPGGTVKQPQMESTIPMTPEQKKAMLDQWRATQPGAQIPEVQDRNWDEEEERFLNGDKPINTQQKVAEVKVDPIQMMFKMFKSNFAVKLNIELEENIPNPTFIGMIQENVEADAVEYYANLISDKLLNDPFKLRTEIYKQLKEIIENDLGTK